VACSNHPALANFPFPLVNPHPKPSSLSPLAAPWLPGLTLFLVLPAASPVLAFHPSRSPSTPTSKKHQPGSPTARPQRAPTPHERALSPNLREHRRGGGGMGEYCASPEGDSALAAASPEATLTFHSPSPAAAAAAVARPGYGSCDRRYVKQVFDNLHGSISLDPVRSAPPLPPSFPVPTSLLTHCSWIG
jgi:hypothetical protein